MDLQRLLSCPPFCEQGFAKLNCAKESPATQTFNERLFEMASWPTYVITREACPDLSISL